VWGSDPGDYGQPDRGSVVSRRKSIEQLDDSRPASRQAQHFLARAKAFGAGGFPKVAAAFEAASQDGILNLESFTKVAMDLALCKSFHESRKVFRLFADVECGHELRVKVSDIVERVRDVLSPERKAIVRDTWRRLDPEDCGQVEMGTILAIFDARRLPRVIRGELDAVEAEREFVEALGASDMMSNIQRDHLALNEAAAGRRPPPIGSRSAPMESAAGKPGAMSRRHERDYQMEIAARRPDVNLSKRVSLAEFEAYYAMRSMSIEDDAIFESTVRGPWMAKKLHEEAMAPRMATQLKHKEKVAASFRILAVFEDGSRRMVRLRDDTGLEEAAQGAGGMHCNQMWTWGPKVKKEVIHRLEAQGHHGIVSVRIQPS
jgi:hypothetical protein